jgi:glucokinase
VANVHCYASLITCEEQLETRGGRPRRHRPSSEIASIERSGGPLAVGIDIGGGSTKLGLVDDSGRVTALHRIPTDAQGTHLSAYLEELIETVCVLVRDAPHEVLGVGMSILGPLNAEGTGPFLSANAPGLVGVNFHDLIAEVLPVPVVINNDLTAHTLAEYYFGSGRGIRRFMCIPVGTGVGAGVVLNGRPLHLWGGTSGDSGRVILEPDADVACGGGVRGSAEALCGTAGIERMARERYGRPVPAHDIIAAARDRTDRVAMEIIESVGQYLGQLIANLYAIFFPDKVTLTGGTAEGGSVLLEACRQRFDEFSGNFMRMVHEAAPDQCSLLAIELGQVKGEAGVVGSVVELFHPEM